jgi:hypothetical protein
LPFYQVFSSDKIKILLFDDLVKDPKMFFSELFEFIGVSSDFLPDTSKRGREGGLPKNLWLHTLLTKPNPLRSSISGMMKLILPLETRQSLRGKLIKDNIAKAKLDKATRRRLIEIYRDDILHLQDLINRDLSHWLS